MLHRIVSASIVVCLVAGPSAAGQQPEPPAALTLEQLMNVDVQKVFGASRFQQRVLEAPASVTIVTHEDIERFGYRTLAELLASVRGLYVSSDRNYSYLGVRGFARPGDYNTRVLLLVDGHTMNDAVYDQAPLGTEFPIDIELVERVEVVRGPSSSLYGTSAFFLVINVITRHSGELGAVSGSAELASQGTRRLRGTISRAFTNGGEVVASASGYVSDGARALDYPELRGTTRTFGIARNVDRDQFSNLFGSFAYGSWRMQAAWGARDKQIPTGAFDTALDDDRNRTRDAHGYADLSYEREWGQTALQVRAAYDRYRYRGVYALEYADGLDPDPSDDNALAEWWLTETSLRRRLGRHRVTAGFEFRDNIHQDQWTSYLTSGTQSLLVRSSSRAGSIYAQDEFHISKRVLLNAGLRHDRNSFSGGSTNPRVGLILLPREATAIKILAGTAFRAPNPYEMFYYTPEVTETTLRPERIRSAEVVLEHYLGRRVRGTVSLFSYRVTDLISQDKEDGASGAFDTLGFRNVDSATATGMGFETEARVATDLHMLGSYQYARARMGGSTGAISNSPAHMAKVGVTRSNVFGRLVFSTELSAMSRRLTLAGTATPAVTLWHVSLGAPSIVRHVAFQLDVRNILDTEYGDPGAEEHRQSVIPQDGRVVRLRATWRF